MRKRKYEIKDRVRIIQDNTGRNAWFDNKVGMVVGFTDGIIDPNKTWVRVRFQGGVYSFDEEDLILYEKG